MKFNSSDSLLLQAVFHTERQDGASLKDIIAYTDYVNHAIMTYAELATGLPKLINVSLVVMDAERVKTTSAFRQWRAKKFKGKKSVQVLKEWEEIEKYLNTTFAEAKEAATTITISSEQFQSAVAAYTGK